MLDFADFVAINKFDRKGAEDALRDVRKQYQRNRERFGEKPDDMPVFGTMAARFNDDGVTALYQALVPKLAATGLKFSQEPLPVVAVKASSAGARHRAGRARALPGRDRRERARLPQAVGEQADAGPRAPVAEDRQGHLRGLRQEANANDFDELITWKDGQLTRTPGSCWRHVAGHEEGLRRRRVRGEDPRQGNPHRLVSESLSGTKIRKVALPRFEDDGETAQVPDAENVPGSFPYTAGVFAFKRENEDPTRMFAGEGDAFRTNRRFKQGLRGHAGQAPVHRLRLGHALRLRPGSAPGHLRQDRQLRRLDRHARRPEGAVRRLRPVCPTTSVSMTINGPAPIILAMFFNTAIDQQLVKFKAPTTAASRPRTKPRRSANGRSPPCAARCRPTSSRKTRARTPASFSTEFALKMMGDIQEFFVHNQVRTSTRCRSPAITSPKPAPTRSASSPSPWPTASPTSKPTWRAACTSTTSRPTCPSSSATAWTRNTR
jgi:methylmalonyl-CoA mutase